MKNESGEIEKKKVEREDKVRLGRRGFYENK